MTRTTFKTVAAGFTALMIGSLALAAPAAAGGSISLTYAPHNTKQAMALQASLQVYGIVNALQHGASIKQMGVNNLAGIGQNGFGNLGIIHQEGKGHSATLQQNGNANSYGIFQFGKGGQAQVVQNGNGQAGATLEFGW